MSGLAQAALLGLTLLALGAFAGDQLGAFQAESEACPEAAEADHPGDEAGSYLLQVRLDHMAKAERQPAAAEPKLAAGVDVKLDGEAATQAAVPPPANVPPEALAPVWPWGRLFNEIFGKPGTQAPAQGQISHCIYIFGLPKLTWAVLCDALGLAVVLLCIPLLLTCSRRRPPGSPLFDCGSTAPPPWQVESSFTAGL